MNKTSLSPREAAIKRGCTIDFIYRELWSGRVPGAQKLGKRWLIPATDVDSAEANKEHRKWNR